MLKNFLIALSLLMSLKLGALEQVVVVGGGIAGMTAALQLSQAGLTPVVITGPTPGGIITVSPDVENWPGDISIAGSALADKLEEQLKKRGVKFMEGAVSSVDFSKTPLTVFVTSSHNPEKPSAVQAASCILALGATPNQLNIPGENDLLYRKVFTCAPCDGLRFKDQTVAVIGGGESSLIEAHYLANIAKHVIVIVRGGEFKTVQPALKEKLLSRPNIKVLFHTSVQRLQDHSDGVKLHLSTHDTLLVQGVFLAIGSRPNTEIFKNALELSPTGYIVLKEGQATSVPGVFAAGDVCDSTYRQAITAAGDATKAALEAIHFIQNSPPATPTEAAGKTSEVVEIINLTQLKGIVQSSSIPIIAYFSSPSCSPCRSFKPLFQKWAGEYGSKALFLKVESSACQDCFDAYKVNAMPTVLIISPEGEVTYRAVGLGHMPPVVQYLEQLMKGSAPAK